MRTTGFMVFAPVCLSDAVEDFLSAVTCCPRVLRHVSFRRTKKLLRARSYDAMPTPDAAARQRGTHRNTTAHSWIATFHGNHAGNQVPHGAPTSKWGRSTT